MNTGTQHTAFVAAAALLSVPFLTPCGTTAVPALALSSAMPRAHHESGRPSDEIRRWSRLDPPPATLRHDASLTRASLIRDNEIQNSRNASDATPREAAFLLLGFPDLLMAAVMDRNSGNPDRDRPEPRETRTILVQSRPHVELCAMEILYVPESDGKGISLALAKGRSQAVIISPEGRWHVIADRIHYRASRHELILEGAPLIKRGRQLLVTSSPDSLVRIRLDSGTISSNKP